MTSKSILQPKYIGWTLFFLTLAVFFVYQVWTFSEFENALYRPHVLLR